MKITTEQQQTIRDKHGICVNEACDKCGLLLGEIRFTIKDQPGEWCSRQCRGGAVVSVGKCQHCKAALPTGLRRDAKYCDATCKKAVQRAKVQPAARIGHRPANYPGTRPHFYAAF
jgi:hypothetical protein